MIQDNTPEINEGKVLLTAHQFKDWSSLNDSIMGGASQAECSVNSDGLELHGLLIEEGGGFVSCRSPIFTPPLNLSRFCGINVVVDGEGRTLKFAIYCKVWMLGLSDLMLGGLHWVAEVPTKNSGTTTFDIPFSSFQPTIRAKSIPFPIRLDTSSITQFQLLHSKFGKPGELNSGFKPGKIKFLIREISGFS